MMSAVTRGRAGVSVSGYSRQVTTSPATQTQIVRDRSSMAKISDRNLLARRVIQNSEDHMHMLMHVTTRDERETCGVRRDVTQLRSLSMRQASTEGECQLRRCDSLRTFHWSYMKNAQRNIADGYVLHNARTLKRKM